MTERQAVGIVLAISAGCSVDPDVALTTQADIACAPGPTIKGMDVSYYDTSVDWTMARQAGIDFAFIRATDGTQYIDSKFPSYWAGARAAGVIRGAYQFFRPAEDPIAQADLLLSKIMPIQPGDLPPVLDVEVNGGLTQTQVAAAVHAWVDHVTAAIGRPPIIYAGLYSWHDLTGSADLTSSPLWVAQYTTAACPNIPVPWMQWMFWQHSDTGMVPGVVSSQLDLNLFAGTRDDLLAFAGPATCGDGVCSGGETPDSCAQDCAPCGTIAATGGEIDDGDACFVGGGPQATMRHVTSSGEQGDLIWTHATADANEANFGDWALYFAEAGSYHVEVYTATAYAQSKQAAYVVAHDGGTDTVTIDQTAVDGWQALGDFTFAAGGRQSIHLGDNTGEAASANHQLVFDAVRLTRLDQNDPPPAMHHDGGGCATGGGSGGAGVVLALAALRRRRR